MIGAEAELHFALARHLADEGNHEGNDAIVSTCISIREGEEDEDLEQLQRTGSHDGSAMHLNGDGASYFAEPERHEEVLFAEHASDLHSANSTSDGLTILSGGDGSSSSSSSTTMGEVRVGVGGDSKKTGCIGIAEERLQGSRASIASGIPMPDALHCTALHW